MRESAEVFVEYCLGILRKEGGGREDWIWRCEWADVNFVKPVIVRALSCRHCVQIEQRVPRAASDRKAYILIFAGS